LFSIFDYLRRLVRDSVLAGVQDAFEIMDQGEHREAITVAAREFLNRSSPALPAPAPAPSEASRPASRNAETAPPQPPSDLIPPSFHLPSQELPRLDGYENYERRKKGSGRPPKQPHPRS
jgi:hypothetical protein